MRAMKTKFKIYLSFIILVCLFIALVMSSIAWFTVNLELDSNRATLTASSWFEFNISVPQEYENEESYMGQTGLQYQGLDSPYTVIYDPITINIEVDDAKSYYLFSEIINVSIDTIIEDEPIILTPQEIKKNFTWRYGIRHKVTRINPDTGEEEEYYEERLYKNSNGFLYDTQTNQPLRIRDRLTYTLRLYLIFLGEEGYSLMQDTQSDIPAEYKFEYSDLTYMWGRFTISLNLGVKELYTVRFNSMGGSYCEPISTTGGEIISLPEPTIADNTKYFGGWYDNSFFEGERFEENTLLHSPRQSDFTLYAKWIDKAVLRFNANGYPGAMPPEQYIIHGEKGFEPQMQETIYWTTTPMSWSEYMSNPQPFDFNSPIEHDVTLYAVWRPRYTVTLHLNNGSDTGYMIIDGQQVYNSYSFTVYEGLTIIDVMPDILDNEPVCTRPLREFKKWSLDGSALTYMSAPTYYFNEPIYQDTHVYAYYGY